MNEDYPVAATLDGVDECDRVTAIAHLHDLFIGGRLPPERFSHVLDRVFAARGHADLAAAMVALPPIIRLTPAPRRLPGPLVLQAADGGLQLGSGWQLAAETTVSTGVGAARLDLSAASWDAHEINLHLETWGTIEVLVPQGVTVQLIGGSGRVRLEPLSPPLPGGPLVRISTAGPAGAIRIRHPTERTGGPIARWKRWRAGRPVSRR